jgi:uncharacterized protein YecT (DUF1311 family)
MHRALTALVAVVAASTAHAEDEPAIDCENARSTYEMNICSDRDFLAADKSLNQTYKKVLAGIPERATEKPYDADSWTAAVRASQRAWVAFRDADCKALVPMEWSGGTGTTAAVLGCMIDKTKAREQELKERYGLK